MSQPGDALEQEADRVAAQVLHTPAPSDDQDARTDAGLRLSRYAAGAAYSSPQASSIVSDVVSSPGEPLDIATREFMEPRFGHDLAHVRIHRDERAEASARSVNAQAYTVGAHVVFDRGEYKPSGDAGKRLLAHELTHVLQENGGVGVVQRREGKYPNPPEPFESRGVNYGASPYTTLKPKKLNVKGPFSAEVLELISSTYTDVPITCSPTGYGRNVSLCVPARSGARYAELVLNMLESSAEFVAIAAKLDAFYADDKNPGIKVSEAAFGALSGTKFVSAGVPFRDAMTSKPHTEDVDVILIDEAVDPRMTAGDTSKPAEIVAAAFVNALVHEAVHAFRRVSKLTKGGLKGSIEEEFETRKKSSAILTEIATASKDKKLKTEVEKHVKAIGADTLTLKDVGLSIASGDEITYVESHFVGIAFGEIFGKYSKTDPTLVPGLADLVHPTLVDPADASDYETELLGLIDRSTERREFLVDRDQSLREEAAGVQPTPRIQKRPAILTGDEALRLIRLIDRKATAKDLTAESQSNVRKLSPAALAVFYHVLLMKISVIKETLKQEHQAAGFPATSKNHEVLSNALAKKYLGETKPYDTLK